MTLCLGRCLVQLSAHIPDRFQMLMRDRVHKKQYPSVSVPLSRNRMATGSENLSAAEASHIIFSECIFHILNDGIWCRESPVVVNKVR